jgi:NADPH:quinone reductase-like Zn-dependent oxidoreductase
MSEIYVRIVNFSTVEIPKPTGKQVLIKIHAVSLNPVDWKSATISTLSFPRKTGVDVAGTVAEVSLKRRRFAISHFVVDFSPRSYTHVF